jgi:uncharacterized protein
MPLFVLLGRDAPDTAELRKKIRASHLEHLKAAADQGRIVHAGPLLDPTGTPVGSLIVLEADTIEAARATAALDPYVTAGVFQTFEVLETRAVFGARAETPGR